MTCDGVWCATLYVQNLGGGNKGCANGSAGDACSNVAHLSEDEFNHALTDYSVSSVQLRSNGQLRLWMNPNIAAGSESLVLHVGSDTFAFQDADQKEVNNRYWNNSGLTWANDDAVELKLTEGPSIDATLSGLALEDGDSNAIALAFASDDYEYEVSVVNGIDAVKLTATKNDGNAMVVITNDDDTNTPDVAELSLNVGSNTLTVTVTAEDGSTELIYTVTVTREDEETPALVSNFNQAAGTVVQFSLPVAQRFTTGSNSGGYTLTSVEIKSEDSQGDTFSVSVCEVDGDGYPTSTCTALTAPGSFAAGTLVFNAPASTTFSASTTYAVVAMATSNVVNYASTSADGEDTGGAVGWTLANEHDFRNTSDVWVTSTSNKSLKVAIKGITGGYTASTDATLSGLALEDGDGNAIALAFASDDYEYEVSVVNGIDAVTLTATKNDSNAMVAITGDTTTTTPDVAELSLNVGPNTLTVTVTAEDGATVLTYTVTVTREATTTTAITLVSNTHHDVSSGASDSFQAQSFETGANAGGYTVSEVDVHLADVSGRSTTVKIRENNASDEPGDLVATLTNPGTLTASSPNTFTAPAGTTLAASTPYWISVNEGISSRASVGRTSLDGETGETGWSIGGRLYRAAEGATPWTSSSTSLLIEIRGTSGGTTLSTDATLSGLALEGATGGETIDLTPVFDAGTITYTASVANGIDAVTLSATKNDSNATVAITGDTTTNSPDEAELSLNVGANTLTVKVTAEDGTLKTYTITVTRADAPTQIVITLVSNTDKTSSGSSSAVGAQSFVTGANPGGYTISEVQVRLSNVNGKSTSVRIRENNNSDEPGALVATLTNPGILTDGLNTFTAPPGTMLVASTTYWITFNEEVTGSRANVAITNSDDETGETGWSIGDDRLYKLDPASSTWAIPQLTSYLIAIKGPTTAATDATLSGLALEGATGGETIDLTPVFDAETITYTASVVNGIDAVKLTATKNDSNAMVVITDDDDPNSPNEAELALVVGANTLTVTVTAEDTTELTYTVTVERAAIPTLVSNTNQSSIGDSANFHAQSFETGANADGYTVSEVDVHLVDVSGRSTSVSIRENNSSDRPGDLVATLTNPGTLTSNRLNTFTAPAGTTLAASKTYWITTNEGISSNRANVGRVGGTGETGEPGWTIGNDSLFRDAETSNWSTSGNALMIEIRGTTGGYTASTDATLIDLTLEDGNDNAIPLAFASDDYEYEVSVVNGIDSVVLSATKNDSNAMVVITDDDDVNTPDEAELSLNVGSNTLTVTVTAEDTTVLIYTVTVTRAVPPDLVVTPSSLTVGEAGSGTFTVKLATQPSGNVTVSVTSDDTGAATASPASLTFTTTNWNTTKTVTVSGVNDSDTDNESLTVTAEPRRAAATPARRAR